MRTLWVWAISHWVILLGAAFVIRLLIAPLAYGFQYDMDTFGSWGQTLVHHPLNVFYNYADTPDHLPGDLYLHYGLATVFQAFGGDNFHGDAYRYLLKVVPSVADILVAILIWMFARRMVGETPARAGALLYALNPATIFLSAIWGQWDVVSGLILLFGLIFAWMYPTRWLLAVPILTWVAMIKPPLAPLCGIGLLAIVFGDLRSGRSVVAIVRSRGASLIAAVVIALASVQVLSAPFATGLPGLGARWSLIDRIDVAVGLYPFTTLGAANIWMIPLGSPDRQSDIAGSFLGLTAKGWGSLLFVGALLYVAAMLVTRWRLIEPVRLVTWAMVTANYAYFLLPTRSHERYMFPAVMLMILLSVMCRLDRRVTTLAIAISLVYFLNLVAVYGVFPGALSSIVFVTLSFANILLFGLVAAFPWWWPSDEHDEAEVVGTPMPVYADDYVTGMIPNA